MRVSEIQKYKEAENKKLRDAFLEKFFRTVLYIEKTIPSLKQITYNSLYREDNFPFITNIPGLIQDLRDLGYTVTLETKNTESTRKERKVKTGPWWNRKTEWEDYIEDVSVPEYIVVTVRWDGEEKK